jgi:hypothetical protein
MSKINILLLIILLVGLIYIYTKKYYHEYMEILYLLLDDIEWTETDAITHIIITRFKEENIDKLIKPIKNKKNVKIFIYNKGNKIESEILEGVTNVKIIKIPNLGWDSYAYIKHVIDNYSNLPDYIYSVHASSIYLLNKIEIYIELINKSKELKINDYQYYGGNVDYAPLNFTIDSWDATTILNKLNNNTMEISKIRPLEKWIKSKIKIIPISMIENEEIKSNYLGMFMVSKNNILKYDIQWYRNILNEISVWQSEVNHYLERSWYIFYNK